jgi:hypothetical protein
MAHPGLVLANTALGEGEETHPSAADFIEKTEGAQLLFV